MSAEAKSVGFVIGVIVALALLLATSSRDRHECTSRGDVYTHGDCIPREVADMLNERT